jgi:hypothetical protein
LQKCRDDAGWQAAPFHADTVRRIANYERRHVVVAEQNVEAHRKRQSQLSSNEGAAPTYVQHLPHRNATDRTAEPNSEVDANALAPAVFHDHINFHGAIAPRVRCLHHLPLEIIKLTR